MHIQWLVGARVIHWSVFARIPAGFCQGIGILLCRKELLCREEDKFLPLTGYMSSIGTANGGLHIYLSLSPSEEHIAKVVVTLSSHILPSVSEECDGDPSYTSCYCDHSSGQLVFIGTDYIFSPCHAYNVSECQTCCSYMAFQSASYLIVVRPIGILFNSSFRHWVQQLHKHCQPQCVLFPQTVGKWESFHMDRWRTVRTSLVQLAGWMI